MLRGACRTLALPRIFKTLTPSMLAIHPAALDFARAASAQSADLFIGHTLPGLAAAAMAAQHHGARLGFDAEDAHFLETDFALHDPVERCAIHTIESTLLPRCLHLTAASPAIGEAYQQRYGIKLPRTVLNVFPLSMAPTGSSQRTLSESTFKMYWFSQTIGPGRGLEAIVDVACHMRPGVILRLRGEPLAGYLGQLQDRAAGHGRAGLIEALSPALPSEMARLAADADLGLSVEEAEPRNRDLCLTNKIFTYLLAGIPQLMTPTRAQAALAPDLEDAALLADINNIRDTATLLEHFRHDHARRINAAKTAATLARKYYNWEREKHELLQSVREALQN